MSDFINARKEFEGLIDGLKLKCALVQYGRYANESLFTLPVGYTGSQLEAFLSSLDFVYDSGYGGQLLHGTVWFEDGTWAERGEYDGSEWWELREAPEIPQELQQIRSIEIE